MIYCVEDDSSIRELMVYTLQASGFEACGFQDAAAFWNMMKEKKPELVILDIMLPGEDGISILKKLRTSPVTEEIPVIMATAKDSEYGGIREACCGGPEEGCPEGGQGRKAADRKHGSEEDG